MAETQKDKRDRAVAAYNYLVHANETIDLLLENQLRSFGLTPSQYHVLEALLLAGPMSQADLAQRIFRYDSSVHVVLRGLGKHGLVLRRAHETDGRKIAIDLTPEGRKLIAKLYPLHARLIRARMTVLGKREQEMLLRLCKKLAEGDPVRFVLELMSVDEDEEDHR